MSSILYYLFLKPLSLLPLFVLYRLSDVLFFLNFYIIGYRKKVVFQNLRRVFPEKSEKELRTIAKGFYRHFFDLIVEVIKGFSISKKELQKRCKPKNPEIFDPYFEKGQSIIITAGHYNNWEMAVTASSVQMPHRHVAIFKPLRNAFFNRKIRASRSKHGMDLLSSRKIKDFGEIYKDDCTALILATDQCPNTRQKAYWMSFLNQDTAVMYGSEKFARQLNHPVFFGKVTKVKRGYYEFEFILVEENPAQASDYSITEKHTQLLEEIILQDPQYWLWTHKRWKRKRVPGDALGVA